MFWIVAAIMGIALLLGAGLVWRQVQRRNLNRWLPAYLRRLPRPAPKDREIHVLICFADHYEPKFRADVETGRKRVAAWTNAYPRQFGQFRDSDGRPPRYTFFYPIEEYEKEYLDALADLCRAGFGEVEIHLHHHDDTPDGMREKLVGFRDLLVNEHGLLGRNSKTGEIAYGFIHGNWSLCNSQPDGRLCGVDQELTLLRSTGCYADFTYPSAPDATQPPIINSIYYARDISGRTSSHHVGWPVGSRPIDEEALLLIQGPLVLDWHRRKWGVFPGVENGCMQASQEPSIERLQNWLRAGVQVASRPDWYFVKLHAHGAPETAHEPLLGEPMVRFHEDLAKLKQENPNFHFHYVTAREMYNLAKAAEAGHQGSIAEARDFLIHSNLRCKPTDYPKAASQKTTLGVRV